MQLFLKAAESKSGEPSAKCINPMVHAQNLSARYSEQLALFTTFSKMELQPDDHLKELRKRFLKQGNLTNIHGLAIEDAVGKLFEALASACSVADYERIKDTCFTSLISARQKLGSEIPAASNLRITN